MAATRLMTVEELETMPGGEEFELFDGVVREHPGGTVRQGLLGIELGMSLYAYATPLRLGTFFSSKTQFVLARNPDTVIRPDVSFLRVERMPPPEEHDLIARIPPDFAAEIVSPDDRTVEVEDKIRRYLAARVPLLWYIDPATRTVTVHARGQEPIVLREGDNLDGGEVFPGFTLTVAGIFA